MIANPHVTTALENGCFLKAFGCLKRKLTRHTETKDSCCCDLKGAPLYKKACCCGRNSSSNSTTTALASQHKEK